MFASPAFSTIITEFPAFLPAVSLTKIPPSSRESRPDESPAPPSSRFYSHFISYPQDHVQHLLHVRKHSHDGLQRLLAVLGGVSLNVAPAMPDVSFIAVQLAQGTGDDFRHSFLVGVLAAFEAAGFHLVVYGVGQLMEKGFRVVGVEHDFFCEMVKVAVIPSDKGPVPDILRKPAGHFEQRRRHRRFVSRQGVALRVLQSEYRDAPEADYDRPLFGDFPLFAGVRIGFNPAHGFLPGHGSQDVESFSALFHPAAHLLPLFESPRVLCAGQQHEQPVAQAPPVAWPGVALDYRPGDGGGQVAALEHI
ncbi:hypothetical protein PTH_2454 [Pelotomaculum thermopropionicum SI]|uniref:Uncharacterized protein n=1 Tax=Pelotomaculum thermopropionicum (strain DSM 13744 / JCM 10971 / SI) TaxID=370438 RepID=A5CZE0_PELTS|nr:hypothetical protein PTH_2454 [Pelotomaculum thermopropionicum SI]